MPSLAHGIILAAGRGTRFGGEKLLAPALGRPLASWAFDAAATALESGTLASVVAVVPRPHHALEQLARSRGFDVTSPADDAPLASSLAAGFAQLTRRLPEHSAAAVIMLADQPALRPDAISRLIEEWHRTGAEALRARYVEDPGVPGHPVLLARPLWAIAAEVTGDHGLASELARRGIHFVPADVPGRNPDIDTAADLEAWLTEVGE